MFDPFETLRFLIIYNTAVFFLYGMDKSLARKHLYRIPEQILLGAAFLGGGPGAIAGMYLFRHKTRHLKFRLLIPFSCLLLALAIAVSFRHIF